MAEAPSEDDWNQAAVYKLTIPEMVAGKRDALLSITYQGDCARLYAPFPPDAHSLSAQPSAPGDPQMKLVADNFQYGRPFLFGLWRLPKGVTELELRILPLQPDAPIYLPAQADKTPGEQLRNVKITFL